MAGTLLSPDQALDIGLIDEIADDAAGAVKRAIERCEQLIALPSNAMLATRALVREDLHALFEYEHSIGVDTFLELWFSESTQKSLNALVQRLQNK